VPGWWSGAALPVGFVRIIRIFRIRTSRARVPQEAGGTQASIHHQSLRRRAARKWRALALHSPAAGIAYPGVHRRAGGHSGAMGNARHCDLSARVARYQGGAALPVDLVCIIRFFRVRTSRACATRGRAQWGKRSLFAREPAAPR